MRTYTVNYGPCACCGSTGPLVPPVTACRIGCARNHTGAARPDYTLTITLTGGDPADPQYPAKSMFAGTHRLRPTAPYPCCARCVETGFGGQIVTPRQVVPPAECRARFVAGLDKVNYPTAVFPLFPESGYIDGAGDVTGLPRLDVLSVGVGCGDTVYFPAGYPAGVLPAFSFYALNNQVILLPVGHVATGTNGPPYTYTEPGFYYGILPVTWRLFNADMNPTNPDGALPFDPGQFVAPLPRQNWNCNNSPILTYSFNAGIMASYYFTKGSDTTGGQDTGDYFAGALRGLTCTVTLDVGGGADARPTAVPEVQLPPRARKRWWQLGSYSEYCTRPPTPAELAQFPADWFSCAGRAAPAAPAAFAAVAPRAAVAARPCRHEGPVLEWTSCNCQGKAVRVCLSDGPEWSRCTRDPNSGIDPDIGSCASCPFYAAAGDSEGDD